MSKVFTTVDYTKEQYHSALSAFIEGSILAVHRGVVLPAGRARHGHLRAGHSAVGDSRPSHSCSGWASP